MWRDTSGVRGQTPPNVKDDEIGLITRRSEVQILPPPPIRRSGRSGTSGPTLSFPDPDAHGFGHVLVGQDQGPPASDPVGPRLRTLPGWGRSFARSRLRSNRQVRRPLDARTCLLELTLPRTGPIRAPSGPWFARVMALFGSPTALVRADPHSSRFCSGAGLR